MKLFKISFISIISILIFQSQLYGINMLRCDFKHRVNDYEFNGVDCSGIFKTSKPTLCSPQESDTFWVSGVTILHNQGLLELEPPDYIRSEQNEKKYKEFKKFYDSGLKVESIFHQPNFGEKGMERDRYIFVLTTGYTLYSLFFDNISKKSILTEYNSLNKVGSKMDTHSTWSKSYFGECEVIN